ncbi:MAG: CBS domain-containing protein [Acetobacteraceae bacterium]|nr:CBS domain-containing protein [Acetobacteraceae bacterium]
MENRHLHDLIRSRAPITMSPGDSVRDACSKILEHHIGCVLVTEQDQLVGIFTGRDAVKLLAAGRKRAGLTLADVMTRRVTTLGPAASALEALHCMQDGGFHHVPIVDRGRLVGVVARRDFYGIEHARLDEETSYWERI